MKHTLIAAGAAFVAFLILDALWIGVIARSTYKSAIGDMMRDNPHMVPAAIFYIMYVLALAYLVIVPNIGNPASSILLAGAIFGMAGYGTYNMTNYSILANWPLHITLIDWAWGITVTSLCALSGWFAVRYFTAQ